MSEKLVLKGFIVTLKLPSDSALRMKCDTSILKGTRYLSFLNELKAFMNKIDFDYAEREEMLRGRELEAHYQSKRVKVRDKYKIVDSKTLWVRPFPSRFENVLKTVRMQAYRLLNNLTICITREVKGRYKDNIYLLPANDSLVNRLFNGIKNLNETLDKLEKEIEKYEKGEEIEKLFSILKNHNVEIVLPYSKKLEISVDLLPIDIDVALEEWASKSPDVAKALREKKQEMVVAMIGKFREKLEPILRMMEGELRVERAKKMVEELKVLANSLGLEALTRTVLNPLEKALKDPEHASKYVPSVSKLREICDARLKSALEKL